MNDTLTSSIRDRLARDGIRPRIADLYSAAGARFYEDMVGGDRSEVREFLALARPVRGPILDLAAGGGRITLPLLSIGKSVTALDLADDMLDRLRSAHLRSPHLRSAHPRRAEPADDALEIVRADMRDFALERRFALVVIAATSITLLDAAGRRRLYDTVRRHLAPHGRFAFSVAGATAARELRRTVDRAISVTSGGRPRPYLSSQEVVAGGAQRIVNFAPLDDDAATPVLTGQVFTTRLHILDEATAAGELADAGFAPPIAHPVRTAGTVPGEGIVILETSWPN